jgi:hypothetical protein
LRKGRIDYRMQRRAQLRDLAAGLRAREDVCDAHPDLVRAGIHIGTKLTEPCPVCSDVTISHVTYVFEGKGARNPGGRAVPRESLARQAERHGAEPGRPACLISAG